MNGDDLGRTQKVFKIRGGGTLLCRRSHKRVLTPRFFQEFSVLYLTEKGSADH